MKKVRTLPFAMPPGLRTPTPVGRQARRETPVCQAYPIPTGGEEAIVTLLTGPHAGQSIAIGPLGLVMGRGDDTTLVLDDIGVSRRHARIGLDPQGGYYVQDLQSTNGTFVCGRRLSWANIVTGDLIQLGPDLQLRFSVTASADAILQRKLYELSVRDVLTQTYNRNHFVERLGNVVALARQSSSDATLFMIDVDELKQINDNHGHLVGDHALTVVASHIKHLTRSEDLLARYGGDEFVLIARGTKRAEAFDLAERIRSTVSDLRFGAGDKTVGVTVSIGVASLSEIAHTGAEHVALVALADGRLYAAKSAGRNRVHACDSLGA